MNESRLDRLRREVAHLEHRLARVKAGNAKARTIERAAFDLRHKVEQLRIEESAAAKQWGTVEP